MQKRSQKQPKMGLLLVPLGVEPYPPIGLCKRLECIHLGWISHLASGKNAVKTEKVQTSRKDGEAESILPEDKVHGCHDIVYRHKT